DTIGGPMRALRVCTALFALITAIPTFAWAQSCLERANALNLTGNERREFAGRCMKETLKEKHDAIDKHIHDAEEDIRKRREAYEADFRLCDQLDYNACRRAHVQPRVPPTIPAPTPSPLANRPSPLAVTQPPEPAPIRTLPVMQLS